MYHIERLFPIIPSIGKYPAYRGVYPNDLQGLFKGLIFAPQFCQMRTARLLRTLYECINPKQTTK